MFFTILKHLKVVSLSRKKWLSLFCHYQSYFECFKTKTNKKTRHLTAQDILIEYLCSIKLRLQFVFVAMGPTKTNFFANTFNFLPLVLGRNRSWNRQKKKKKKKTFFFFRQFLGQLLHVDLQVVWASATRAVFAFAFC